MISLHIRRHIPRNIRLKRFALRLTALLFALTLAGESLLIPKANADDTGPRKTFYRWTRVDSHGQFTRDYQYHRLFMVWNDGGNDYYFKCNAIAHYPNSDDQYYNLYSTANLWSELNKEFSQEASNTLGTWYSSDSLRTLYYIYHPGGDAEWNFYLSNSDDSRSGSGFYNNDGKFSSGGSSQWRIGVAGWGGAIWDSPPKWYIWHRDNDDGSDDEYLYHDGTSIRVKEDDEDDEKDRKTFSRYRLWHGDAIDVHLITGDATYIQNEQLTTHGQPLEYIEGGTTLTVKDGGVLVVSGVLLNDGTIKVEEGGMVIIKENSAILPFTKYANNRGGFISEGNVILRKNAKLIGGGATGIWIKSGAVLNNGVIMSEYMTVKQPYLIENRSGAKVFAGYSVGYRVLNGIIDDAVNNNGVEASKITTSYKNSDITTSTTSTYYGSAIVDIADNGIYGPGEKNIRSGVKTKDDYVLKVYTKDGAPGGGTVGSVYEKLFTACVRDVKAERRSMGWASIVQFTVSGQTYQVDTEGLVTQKYLLVQVDNGAGVQTLYDGPASGFNPSQHMP